MKYLPKIILISLISIFLFSSCNPEKSGKIDSSKVNLTKGKNNVLSGEFSIDSNGTKIRFLKGNLIYDRNTEKWDTEENQYDYRTWSGKNSCISGIWNQTGTPAGTVGQFYWSKDIKKAVAENYSKDGATTSDSFFAKNLFADCFILNQQQFDYLLKSRTTASALGHIVIPNSENPFLFNYVKGLIILPDNWETPEGVTYIPGAYEWDSNEYTIEEWEVMENAGAVFLPGFFYRRGSEIQINDESEGAGFYWTCTPNSSSVDNAFALSFYKVFWVPEGSTAEYACIDSGNDREDGYFIRCVCLVK